MGVTVGWEMAVVGIDISIISPTTIRQPNREVVEAAVGGSIKREIKPTLVVQHSSQLE